MTALELAREAAAIVPPVGASRAIAVHDGTHHRAAFLVQGRLRSAPVGPAFTKPRDVCRFVDVLNGEPTPRSAPGSDLAGDGRAPRSRDVDRTPIEAPASLEADPRDSASDSAEPVRDPAAVPSAAGVRACAICGRPLPPGSRSHRRTDTDSCRRALARANEDPLQLQAKQAAWAANRRARTLGVDGTLTAADVLALWDAQPTCLRCGSGRGLDHISPMASGGANVPANLQNLCPACNSLKAGAERPVPGRPARRRRRVEDTPTSSLVPLSEAPDTVPTSPAGPRGYALRGSAEDAGPTTSPGSQDPGFLNLGLT